MNIEQEIIEIKRRLTALELSQPRKAFVKPTPEEVTEYGKSILFNIDGEQFCSFYESKGWKIGNNAMKNWQAAVRTWKKSAKNDNKSLSSIGQTCSFCDKPAAKKVLYEKRITCFCEDHLFEYNQKKARREHIGMLIG